MNDIREHCEGAMCPGIGLRMVVQQFIWENYDKIKSVRKFLRLYPWADVVFRDAQEECEKFNKFNT